jgi:hypothetical protein
MLLRRAAAARAPAQQLLRHLCAVPPPQKPGLLGRLADRAREAVVPSTGARKKAVDKMTAGLEDNKGWRAALDDGLATQQLEKREDFVRERMRKLGAMEVYGFDALRAEYQEALDEIDSQGMMTKARLYADKLSGGDQSATLEKQKADTAAKIAVIDELTPSERRKPKLLDRRARADIAQKNGLDAAMVDRAILEYDLQRAQWAFLRREHLRGRPIPTSSAELEWRMQARPTREFVHAMEKHQAALQEEQERAGGGGGGAEEDDKPRSKRQQRKERDRQRRMR